MATTTSRPPKVIPNLCRNFVISTVRKSFTSRDTILYALGLGLSTDPIDPLDLRYTYENSESFAALPSFVAVIPPLESLFDGLLACPGIPDFNPMLLLHGEERLTFSGREIPTEATVECVTRIADVEDKGKAALVRLVSEICQVDDGKGVKSMEKEKVLLCSVEASMFVRGIGGFQEEKLHEKKPAQKPTDEPSSPPHLVIQCRTDPRQALLYRLSGTQIWEREERNK